MINDDILVAIGVPLLIAGTIAFKMYLNHKRTIAMIEHGLDPRQTDVGTRTGRSMESILTTIAVGLAVTIGLSFIGFGPWLLAGLIPMFIGLARLLALVMQDAPAATAIAKVETPHDQ